MCMTRGGSSGTTLWIHWIAKLISVLNTEQCMLGPCIVVLIIFGTFDYLYFQPRYLLIVVCLVSVALGLCITPVAPLCGGRARAPRRPYVGVHARRGHRRNRPRADYQRSTIRWPSSAPSRSSPRPAKKTRRCELQAPLGVPYRASLGGWCPPALT